MLEPALSPCCSPLSSSVNCHSCSFSVSGVLSPAFLPPSVSVSECCSSLFFSLCLCVSVSSSLFCLSLPLFMILPPFLPPLCLSLVCSLSLSVSPPPPPFYLSLSSLFLPASLSPFLCLCPSLSLSSFLLCLSLSPPASLCLSHSQGPAGLPGIPGIDGIQGLPGTVIMMPVRGRQGGTASWGVASPWGSPYYQLLPSSSLRAAHSKDPQSPSNRPRLRQYCSRLRCVDDDQGTNRRWWEDTERMTEMGILEG